MKKTKMSTPTAVSDDEDWKADDDMRALLRAEEIKQDKERMAKVHKRVGRHHKAVTSLKDLSDIYNQKFGKGGTMEAHMKAEAGEGESKSHEKVELTKVKGC